MNSVTARVSLGNYQHVDVTADDAESLLKALSEVSALAPPLVEAVNVIAAASKATAVKANIEKPASRSSAEPGSKNCACGIPMNDVRGDHYKSGEKKGQPYPYDFYPTCKTKETGCKPE